MQESVKGNEKKLDQSQKMAMEDSTAMTIEFLRARLLAERSISRTAQQKADGMAKRVVELEEKLKLVTLQRKKAEKATSEVLAILDDNGISDFSEVYDSNSEQEGVVGGESKDTDDIKEKEGSLATSRQMAIQVNEPSGLELGVLPLIGRSLSWKSCDHSPISRENRKSLEATRKCSSFVSSGGSSTRYHLGRSRRQTKQREARSAELKVEDHSFLCDSQECEVSTTGDTSRGARHVARIIKESQRNEEEKVYLETLAQGSLDDQRKEANDILASNGSERNVELQRALEYQAQLIGQFKAEENAQREWEEKFKGNSCYSPDSCEHGNQSDITEEREEIRAETSGNVDTNPYLDQGGSEHTFYNGEKVEDRINHIPAQPHKDDGSSQEQQFNKPVNHSHNTFHEFSFPGHVILEARSSEKQKPGCSENSSCHSASYGSSKHQEAQFSSSYVGGSFHKGELSEKALQVATPDKTSNGLGGVLDALQRAKLSLKNELNRVSLSTADGLVAKTKKPSGLVINGDNGMEIPVGSAGLFRVPTSSQYGAPSKPSSLTHYSESESSLARYHSSSRIEAKSKGRYTSSPYSDIASVNSTRRSLIDPYMDKGIGLPSSSRYIMYPSYVDLMPRMSASDAFSRNYPGIGLGTSGNDGYSQNNDRMRLDMYKRK